MHFSVNKTWLDWCANPGTSSQKFTETFTPQNMPANYWSDDLLGDISRTINKPCIQPSETEFKFKLNKESAANNFCILKNYVKDLVKAIESQSKSPLGYSLEFRPTSTLKNIFNRQPNWSRMKDILENGSNWPLEELEEGNRWTGMAEAISFRNHKGAKRNPLLLRSLVERMLLTCVVWFSC